VRLVYSRNADNQSVTYTLKIDDADMCAVNLTAFDHMMLRECEGSESIADKMLALETLCRRVEESSKAPSSSPMQMEGSNG